MSYGQRGSALQAQRHEYHGVVDRLCPYAVRWHENEYQGGRQGRSGRLRVRQAVLSSAPWPAEFFLCGLPYQQRRQRAAYGISFDGALAGHALAGFPRRRLLPVHTAAPLCGMQPDGSTRTARNRRGGIQQPRVLPQLSQQRSAAPGVGLQEMTRGAQQPPLFQGEQECTYRGLPPGW